MNGANISFGKGATVDISGGGDLQAQEWIPGTGGSRDVLSQYQTSYQNSATGQKVPTYPDAVRSTPSCPATPVRSRLTMRQCRSPA